jgi:hypothetical protein
MAVTGGTSHTMHAHPANFTTSAGPSSHKWYTAYHIRAENERWSVAVYPDLLADTHIDYM